MPITIEAVDAVGNEASLVRTVRVVPLDDPDRPRIAFRCPTDGALLAPGTGVNVAVDATDDQGVETRGDAKQVARGFGVVHGEEVGCESIARQSVVLAQEVHQLFPRALGIVARDVDLRPVAGREHHRFGRRWTRRQRLDRRAEITAREIEAFPQVDGRRLVTHAEQEEMHLS